VAASLWGDVASEALVPERTGRRSGLRARSSGMYQEGWQEGTAKERNPRAERGRAGWPGFVAWAEDTHRVTWE
jgi:hypothetical protein